MSGDKQTTLAVGEDGLTDVIFRKWRGKYGGIIALFPTEPGDCAYTFLCFEHVGQHGVTDGRIIARTSPAFAHEYADLKRELESPPYSYRLRVVRRITPQHRKRREAALKF